MKTSNVKIGNIAHRYNVYIDNSKGFAIPTVPKSRPAVSAMDDNTTPETHLDPRFIAPCFRKAVRACLEYCGLKPSFENFRKHDKSYGAKVPFNWYEFARRINEPSPEVELNPAQVHEQLVDAAKQNKTIDNWNECKKQNKRSKK